MGFSRQRYWSRLPFLPPGDLLNPGIEPKFFMSAALAGSFFTTSTTWEALGFMVPFYFDYLPALISAFQLNSLGLLLILAFYKLVFPGVLGSIFFFPSFSASSVK